MPAGLKRVIPQLITLAVLVALVSLFFPSFLQIEYSSGRFVGPVIDVLKRGAPVALLAIGMTLVVATRGIDLSVGTVIAITGAMAAATIGAGYGLAAAIAMAVIAGLMAGLFNGVLVAFIGIQPIVATLILMISGRGIAQLITEGRILTFNLPGFAFLGSGSLLGIPVPVWIWVLTAALAILLVRRTALGLLLEASGVNRRASELAGS
ncbi:MAG: ABC transporter permease, partial [Martelella sp.]